jgi:hypothetical protein
VYVPIPQAAASLYFTFSLLPAPAGVEGGIKGREKRTLFSGNRCLTGKIENTYAKKSLGTFLSLPRTVKLSLKWAYPKYFIC